MFKWLAKKINASEYKKIEEQALERRKEDRKLIELFDALERKDKELRKQHEKYYSLLNGVSVFLWYVPAIDRMGICNDAFANFFGIKDKKAIEGVSLKELLSPDQLEICIENNRKVFESGEQITSEEWVTRHDGVRRLWKIVKTPYKNRYGHIVHAVACGQDITEEREAEIRNKAMLEAIPDLMFIHDRFGNYLDYHANDPRLLIKFDGNIIGRNVCEFFDDEIAHECRNVFEKAFTEHTIQIFEYNMNTLAGDKRFEARIVPLNGTRLLSIVRDITNWPDARENMAEQIITLQTIIKGLEHELGRDAE